MSETRPRRATALVTGASGGIGLELARLLAADGHDLVLVARSRERLDEEAAALARDHGVTATAIALDLAGPEAPERLHDDVRRRGLEIDVLVNNAGFGSHGRFVETDWEPERRMIQLNMLALTGLTKRFLPGMVERRRGRVLNVASTAAFQPGPLMAVYYATKAYVLSFSEAIAEELRGTGVTVTALCPGPTLTGFQGAAGIGNVRLIRGAMRFLVMDAASVARIGYRALMRGRPVVVAGRLNRLLAWSVRITPRSVVRRISRWTVESV
jgi:uncharacterized protein